MPIDRLLKRFMAGRGPRPVVTGLVLALGLGLGLTWEQAAVAGTPPKASVACPSGSVQGPPDADSSEPYTCLLVADLPVVMPFSDAKPRHRFRMHVPAKAHLTLDATGSADLAYVEVDVEDRRLDGDGRDDAGFLSTGPDSTYENLFFEVPSLAVPRTVIMGFDRRDGPDQTMRVTPRLAYDLPAIRLHPDAPTTVSTNEPGQNRALTFTGAAGHVIRVRTADSTYPSFGRTFRPPFSLTLTGPDGSVVIDPNTMSTALGAGPGTSKPVRLSASGLHTITVDPTMDGTGSVRLELLDVTGVA